MPKPKNKKAAFIDKNNAVSFHLVHRSQQDPLAADDTAPQMVLQSTKLGEQWTKVKEEEREFGVFYEDEYNYLQHLKDRNKVDHDWSEADRFVLGAEGGRPPAVEGAAAKPRLVLPAAVFATEGEEEAVGLLNKAARTGLDLSLDPDVVAALDEAMVEGGDPDNEMEDDFIMAMMGEGDGEEDGSEDEEMSDVDSEFGGGRSEAEDEVPSLRSWDGEETKTRFTDYSMSSSCIRRNQGLALMDDKFDRFFGEYGDGEEGALEGEEIEGALEETDDRMAQLVTQHEEEKRRSRQQLEREREVTRERALRAGREEMVDLLLLPAAETREKQWDAETILTTYSTKYNHPKVISERNSNAPIRFSTKTGIPLDTLGRGLTKGALQQLDREAEEREMADDVASIRSRMTECSVRPQHETPEEKRARKAEVRSVRKERREEKKANTQAFKSEKVRQEKININVKNNVQGIKIC